MGTSALVGGCFLIAAAVAAVAWSRLAAFERRTVVLENARRMPLRLVVFEPLRARRPFPAVLVCQPVNSPPEAGQALILEFARRGMLAATFDFRGQAPGENRVLLRQDVLGVTALDAAAALAYLAGRGDVDRRRIGLIGHSVGGTLAIRAGIEQPWVRATIAVGIAGDVTRTLPQNLLWLVGLYDEFRPLSEMHQVMEASNAEGLAQIEQTAGDFRTGTARRLGVSATADHFTEFLNHGAVARAAEWFESAFSGSAAPRPRLALAPCFYACYSLAFLSGWWLLWRRLREADWLRRLPARAFSSAMAALLALLLLLPLPRLALFRADLVLWGLALLVGVNAGLRPGRAAWLVPLGWASLLLTLVLNQVAYFWRYPHLLYALPALPFWHFTGLLNSYLFIYPRGLLFSSYTEALLRPGWLVLALLAAEIARPGIVLGGPWSLLRRAHRSQPAGVRRINWAAWGALLLLLAALGAIVSLRAAQGFVSRQSLGLAAWVLLRFAVLPFFIFALLKRRLLGPSYPPYAAPAAGAPAQAPRP